MRRFTNGRSAIRTPFNKSGITKRRINAQKICLQFMGFITVVLIISYNRLISNTTNHNGHTSHKTHLDVESPTPKHFEEAILPVAKEKVIGYAVSLTGCGDKFLTDGAAILKHSVHLNSIQNPKSKSRYSYKMIAIVHPTAVSCSSDLEEVGYKILVRDTPVAVSDIEGQYLREKVEENGCCGEKEFIKLWAYTLTEFPIVVHLDIDTLVLQPLDDLFDSMSVSGDTASRSNLQVMFNKPTPPLIDGFFTRDYNMARPPKKQVSLQGGFLVLRPSPSIFEEYKAIIRKGDFRRSGGWGGSGYGGTYGSMTFQGIVPYFYDVIHPNTAVELNRCYYNAMADNPRMGRTVNNVVSGKCRDGTENCKDCREIDVSEIKTAHFTLCQKPWLCLGHTADLLQHRLCRKMHKEWFKVRFDLEGKHGAGGHDVDQFFGFCKQAGTYGYIPFHAS